MPAVVDHYGQGDQLSQNLEMSGNFAPVRQVGESTKSQGNFRQKCCQGKLAILCMIAVTGIDCRGRPNFVFGRKNDDFLFFGVLFFGRKSLMCFWSYFSA